jgi:MFS transporter, SP family, general alpha glucoside:H+ symporter
MEKLEEVGGLETPVDGEIQDVSTKKIGDDARIATEIEHQMTFMQAVKIYPKAMGWSVFFSLGVIMTGFDPQLLGSLFAEPAFQRDFGYKFGDGYIISAPWQTALSMGNPLGQVIGALGAGYPMEWYGRRKVCCHSTIWAAFC